MTISTISTDDTIIVPTAAINGVTLFYRGEIDGEEGPGYATTAFPCRIEAKRAVFLGTKEHLLPPAGGHVKRNGHDKPPVTGMTSTPLVKAQNRGSPCLYFIHLTANILQARQRHHSSRFGLVTEGGGRIHWGDDRNAGRILELTPGMAFHIPAGDMHAIETGPEGLDFIAYLPTSI